MILTDCISRKLTDLLIATNDVDNVNYPYNLSEDYRTLETRTQQEWHSAIASLEKILAQQINQHKNRKKAEIEGVIISSPTPVINNIGLINSLETIVFSQPQLNNLALMPCNYSQNRKDKVSNFNHQKSSKNKQKNNIYSHLIDIPLSREDSLRQEQFCLVLTVKFSCLIVKGITEIGLPKFDFSFAPEIVNQAWFLLRERIEKNQHPKLAYLDQLKQKFNR